MESTNRATNEKKKIQDIAEVLNTTLTESGALVRQYDVFQGGCQDSIVRISVPTEVLLFVRKLFSPCVKVF